MRKTESKTNPGCKQVIEIYSLACCGNILLIFCHQYVVTDVVLMIRAKIYYWH